MRIRVREECFLGGAAPPPDPPPLPAKLRFPWQISIFQNHDFSIFKLREIVFMGFLTHRNLPETLGGHIQQNENFGLFDFFLHGPIFHIFSKCPVCYNSYQGLSWTRISSKFLFLIKSYVDSTIQILKIIVIRLRGETTLMIKRCFLKVIFCPFLT